LDISKRIRIPEQGSISPDYQESEVAKGREDSIMGETLGSQFVSLLGIFVMIGIAVLISRDRKRIKWRTVGAGLALQLTFALLVLKTKPGEVFFSTLNIFVMGLLDFTKAGSSFIFGGLVTDMKSFGFIFAFQVLPTIIFFSSLMGVLYYLGIMQKVVQLVAKVIIKVMGTSGAETLVASANIFMGHTEAPLLVKPYIETMTRSELLAVMTAGFATIAAGVMAAYVGILSGTFPAVAGHLLTASVISAPAALMFSKIIIPETEQAETLGTVKMDMPRTDANIIDAAANGAGLGLQLALNVGAMLLAFIALIAMLNYGLGLIGWFINLLFGTHITLSFEAIFGTIFSPVAWILGVPWKDCPVVGNLLGKVLVINEFVAYSELGNMLQKNIACLSPRSVMIAVYALCGFANFSSIAIQIGGIGSLAPSRRSDLAKLGIFGLMAGTLANYQTAALAGLLVPSVTLIAPAPAVTPSPSPPSSPRTETMILRYHDFPSRDAAMQDFLRSRGYELKGTALSKHNST
jgi:concentrative nucleoside transporter, CNT family